MSRFSRSTGGTIAAIAGVTVLVATTVTVFATGAFTPPESEAAEPSGSGSSEKSGLEYHFDKTLCGAMDWEPIESVAKIADDIDADKSEVPETKSVTVECSVLLEGHPQSQVYLNVTTFASAEAAEKAHEGVQEQQRQRVTDVSELDGEWDDGVLGTGNESYDVYVDALVHDSNASGSVVIALNGDSVSDPAAQEKAAKTAVAAVAKSMLDVLRLG